MCLLSSDVSNSWSRQSLNHRPNLADVAGPRRFFLSGRSQEDDRERRTIWRLHHNLELQVVEALACSVVWKNTEKTQSLFPRCHSFKTAVGTQLGRVRLLTVLVAGVQLLDESAFDQRERSSLLLVKIIAPWFTHSQLALEQLDMTAAVFLLLELQKFCLKSSNPFWMTCHLVAESGK